MRFEINFLVLLFAVSLLLGCASPSLYPSSVRLKEKSFHGCFNSWVDVMRWER